MTKITIDRSVVEQTLEAMLNFPSDISDEMFESLRSLKAALAQQAEPTPGEYHGWVLREVLFDRGEPVGHREPVQEPVAGAAKSVHEKAYSEVELSDAYQQGWNHAMRRRSLGPHIITE